MVNYSASGYLDLAAVGEVTRCRLQEEEGLLGHGVVELANVLYEVTPYGDDLDVPKRAYRSTGNYGGTFFPFCTNEAMVSGQGSTGPRRDGVPGSHVVTWNKTRIQYVRYA